MKRMTMMAIGVVLAFLLVFTGSVCADSDFQAGTGDASVDLDFEIIIPSFVYFRVGDAGIIDTVSFDATGLDLATAPPIEFDGVEVELIGNVGNIIINQTRSGTLETGTKPSFDDISVDIGTGSITPPNVSTGLGGGALADASGFVDQDGTWDYTYTINTADLPAGGTYTGLITYTVTIP